MPAALALVFVMLSLPSLQIQCYVSPAHAGPGGGHGRSTGFCSGRRVNKARRREVPRQHRKRLEARASTPPAVPPSCAGCGRPARRSSAATRSPEPRCAFWYSAASGRASRSGPRPRSPSPSAPARPVRYLATGAVVDDDDVGGAGGTHRDRRPQHWSTVESTDVATQLTRRGREPDAGRRHRRLARRGDGPPAARGPAVR